MSEIRIKTLVVGMVGTNCYLVYDNETKRAAVIDPGDGAGQIVNMAVSLGLKPEAILLTHGHFDHMMAAKELKEAWHVPIYACEKEIEVLSDSRKSLVSSYYREPYTLTPDITVKEGDELSIAGFTWKVFETPGHLSLIHISSSRISRWIKRRSQPDFSTTWWKIPCIQRNSSPSYSEKRLSLIHICTWDL